MKTCKRAPQATLKNANSLSTYKTGWQVTFKEGYPGAPWLSSCKDHNYPWCKSCIGLQITKYRVVVEYDTPVEYCCLQCSMPLSNEVNVCTCTSDYVIINVNK